MIRIFFLSQSSPILELFLFDKITLKSYICTVVTVMAKQCWSQTVLESGSWGHSVLQTPALVLAWLSPYLPSSSFCPPPLKISKGHSIWLSVLPGSERRCIVDAAAATVIDRSF